MGNVDIKKVYPFTRVVSLIATSPLTSRDNEPRWWSNMSCVLECFLSTRMSLPLGDLQYEMLAFVFCILSQ